jgi:hypothetical protein
MCGIFASSSRTMRHSLLPLLLTLLAAAGARADEKAPEKPVVAVRVMVVDLKATGVDESVARNLTDLLAGALAQNPALSVASSEDVRAMLRATQEQQLAGCVDDKCYEGLASMLGAQSVVSGTVGRVGDTFVLNVTRLDAAKGTVVGRVNEVATKPDELIGRVERVAQVLAGQPGALKLVGGVGDGKPVGAGFSAIPLERIATREQAVWAAVQYDKARKAKVKRPLRLYATSFTSDRFQLDGYDKLEEQLPLKPDLWFPGPYPSCFGRSEPFEDAFTVKEERPLVLKVGSEAATDLRDAKREKQLVLDVEFEIVGARVLPMKEYDWHLCDGATKPFNPADVSPNAFIKVKAAVLRDRSSGKRYAVTRQDWDPGAQKASLVSLPAPLSPPDADEDD